MTEEQPLGPFATEIEELFTRNLAGHPAILHLTTGQFNPGDPDLLTRSFEALSLLAVTEREALRRIAREIDNLRAA